MEFNTIYNGLISGKEKLALVGLGYVGMPIAVNFAQKGLDVIGFDLDKKKIDLYDNTSIDAVMLGSEVAYSYGNNDITYSVNDTQYDEQHLANQKYYGNNSKILVKNPNNNVEWNEDNFSKAIFTITNKIKNS